MTDTLACWLARIEQLHPAEIELGLARVTAVGKRLNVLKPPIPVITVAGTNGKGSTVALIESLARARGIATGVYTSPHIHHFSERVRIAGQPCTDQAWCAAFERVECARDDIPLTYFEFATLAALDLFQQTQGLGLLVLEVGLGGRLDAVNCVDPDVAVITSIGLDHMDWLGHDRESIAVEKAGISRAGRPLLYGEADMPDSVRRIAADVGASLLRAGQVFWTAGKRIRWLQDATALQVELAEDPPLGADNLVLAVQALELTGIRVSADDVHRASQRTLAGRSEYHRLAGVDWYFDVGHNCEALARFAQRVPKSLGRSYAVCAMLGDKPADAVLPFVSRVAHWYLADLAGLRAGRAERLDAVLPSGARRSCHATVAEAVAALSPVLQAADQVLVFGSFHTVGEARCALGITDG